MHFVRIDRIALLEELDLRVPVEQEVIELLLENVRVSDLLVPRKCSRAHFLLVSGNLRLDLFAVVVIEQC